MEPRSQRLVTEAKIDAVVDTAVEVAIPPAVDAAVAPLVTQAITDSVIEAYDPFDTVLEDDIAFAVVDEDGRRTWLEAGLDGAPSAYAAQIVTDTVTPAVAAAVGIGEQDETLNDLSVAIVDEDNRRTWLEADLEGKPTARSAGMLQDMLTGGDATASTYRDHLGVERGIVSGPGVMLNGDSLTAQGSWHTTLADLTGVPVRRNAAGGESSSGIAARHGATPFMLAPVGGVIPASGSVDIITPISTALGYGVWPMLQGVNPLVGTLAGVHGTFRLTKEVAGSYTHGAGDVYSFTRTTAGDAVTVDRPAPFYYDLGESSRGDVHVYWAGRNNTTASDRIMAELDAMIQHQTGLDKRFLVIGITNGAGEGTGTTTHTNITTHNKRLEKYGRRYVQLREYLIAYGLRDAGITPTDQDTADIAADIIPDSLRTDTVHFEVAAQNIIAQHIAERLEEMGWV